ncbi:MAG TPA: glycosyltransferase family 4 protein [Acidimicrobiales bacterium]|nr:glycosyltransferase family 4 protein [Acidimicrobiales bacterium]
MTAPIERVALVSPYALSVPGGVQTQVRAMARDLSHRGIDVVVCSPGEPDEPLAAAGIAHAAAGAVRSVRANGSRAPVTLSRAASRAFASVAATLRDGVVHVHEPFAPIAAYDLLREHRRPTVGTFHRGGGGPAYVVGAPVIRRLRRGLDVTAAVSRLAVETIGDAAGARPELLFNGVELDLVDAATPWPTTGPTVLFVGRHEARKGLDVLLDAIGRIELPIACWVLGDGPQTASLRERHRADARIEWLGATDDDEKLARLRGADVLCVPSLGGESFGLVPLEGMAARTAVVASDIDGYRESTGGHATLVAPGDAGVLAVALRTAIERPATDRALDAARAHAERWSVHALVERYLELYARAAASFASSSAVSTPRGRRARREPPGPSTSLA